MKYKLRHREKKVNSKGELCSSGLLHCDSAVAKGVIRERERLFYIGRGEGGRERARKSSTLLEGSQVLPARPSGRSSMIMENDNE